MPERSPTGRKRVRLSPDVRSRQILDAALVEFSRHGFTGSRIEDIARRAGLSKSGIYAHYAGKEEIFEALLVTALSPPDTGNAVWQPPADLPLPALIDSYLDQLYARLQDPVVLATFRLMIAESERVPELIRRWYARVQVGRAREQAVVDACVARGVVRRSVLTDNFSLAASPALMWMTMHIVLKDDAPIAMLEVREAHRRLLLEVLQPA